MSVPTDEPEGLDPEDDCDPRTFRTDDEGHTVVASGEADWTLDPQ